MSKSQRTKGAAGEREWCAKLAEHGITAKRNIDQTRDGGEDVPAPPMLWEVKRRRRISIYKWMDQVGLALVKRRTPGPLPVPGLVSQYQDEVAAVAAGSLLRIPAVAMRADNREWLVTLAADDFLRLLTKGEI